MKKISMLAALLFISAPGQALLFNDDEGLDYIEKTGAASKSICDSEEAPPPCLAPKVRNEIKIAQPVPNNQLGDYALETAKGLSLCARADCTPPQKCGFGSLNAGCQAKEKAREAEAALASANDDDGVAAAGPMAGNSRREAAEAAAIFELTADPSFLTASGGPGADYTGFSQQFNGGPSSPKNVATTQLQKQSKQDTGATDGNVENAHLKARRPWDGNSVPISK